MTEKRFALVKCYNEQWGIVDKSLEEIDQLVLITTSKSGNLYLVNELNKLANENEQLKKQIGNLDDTKDFCADVCADCKRLEKENEQLKQFIDELTTKGTGRINLMNGYSYKVSAVLTNWKKGD